MIDKIHLDFVKLYYTKKVFLYYQVLTNSVISEY